MPQNIWRKNYIYVILFTVLALGMLYQSFYYHKRNDHTIWKKENHADAAGYYAYLMMWYDYGYQSKDFPKDLDSALGKGFRLNGPIVKDKYTCGEAYLLSPFYLTHKAMSHIKHGKNLPDSIDARRTIDIAAIFYVWAAALCLFFFLIRFFKKPYVFISIIMIVAGTNVFFYAVYAPGMSHIYSFFLFSAYLLLGHTFLLKRKRIYLFLVAATGATIVLTRPTDILFLPILFFLTQNIRENFRILFKPVHLMIILVASILVFTPQMYYWYISSGKIIYYSYTKEGFSNILHPKILQVLFAPYNGLVPYSLLFIVLVPVNIYAIIKKQTYAIYFFVYQLLAIYLIASWWAPSFGDGYGQRNYVQIFAGYAFILAFALEQMMQQKRKVLLILFSLISLSAILLNQKIIYKFDHMFGGRTTWNWKEYRYYINNNSFTVKLDFENLTQVENVEPFMNPRSGSNVLSIKDSVDQYAIYAFKKKDIPYYARIIKCYIYIYTEKEDINYDVFLFLVEGESKTQVAYAGKAHYRFPVHQWKKSTTTLYYQIPDEYGPETTYVICLKNWKKQNFKIDDIQLVFR